MTTRRVVLVVAALSLGGFGLLALLAPDTFASTFGAHLDRFGYYVVRVLGVHLVALAVVDALAVNAEWGTALRGILVANAVGFGASTLNWVWTGLDGTVPGLAWTSASYDGVVTVGLRYALLAERRVAAQH